MARDLNSALRARRARILKEGKRSFRVFSDVAGRPSVENVRDWETALFRASRGFAERGGYWAAEEMAWDPDYSDSYLVAGRRVFE